MNPQLIYLIVSVILAGIILLMANKSCLLKDSSSARPEPFSFSRVQITWWTWIILSAFVSIIASSGKIPDIDTSSLILLGIGSLTTVAGRLIDISDRKETASPRMLSINQRSDGFWIDILSDKDGISIHRLQAAVFNVVFGAWFIFKSVEGIVKATASASDKTLNEIIPIISEKNLILLGLSAGTYVALKTAENK